MGTIEDDATVRVRLEGVSACLEELKIWSDAQLDELQSRLHAQFARLQLEVAELLAEVPASESADYATRLEAQLRQLTDRGDAVYALLRDRLEPESQGRSYRGTIGATAASPAAAPTAEPPAIDRRNRH